MFSTGPQYRSYGWNLVTEAIATFVLVFVVLAAGHWQSSPLGWLGALGVGLLVASLRGSSEPATAAAGPAAPAAPFVATQPDAPAATSNAFTADAPAAVDATPVVAYDDDATSTLPPQPGSDPA